MPHLMDRCFELDEEGDIRVTVQDGVRAARLIEGSEEIEQAFVVRFKTRQGEDDFFPTIGFPIDQVIGLFNEDYIAGKVRETLLQDPRVESVGDLSIELDRVDRIVDVEANVILVDESEVLVSVTL